MRWRSRDPVRRRGPHRHLRGLLTRIFGPLVLAGGAAWVRHYNGTHDDSAVFLPFVDRIFPATAGDPRAMGAATVTVLSALAGVWLVVELIGFARERARGKAADE